MRNQGGFIRFLPLFLYLGLIVVILLSFFFPTIFPFATNQASLSQLFPSKTENIWQNYDQQVKEKTIKPPTKILEVSLEAIQSQNGAENPTLKITGVSKKNGYQPKLIITKPQFRLLINDKNDKTILEQPIEVPFQINDPPPNPDETPTPNPTPKESTLPLSLTDVKFLVTINWNEDATQIKIVNQQNQVVESKQLEGSVKSEDNKPKFSSINGANLKSKKESFNLLDFLQPKVSAASDGAVNITFIGDNYTNLDQFHQDVSNFSSYLLAYEPFKSRSSSFSFHYVDNKSSLGCSYYMGRAIVCDSAKVRSAVNSAGAPNDYIIVIENNGTYGGATTDIAAVYNGSQWGKQVFVHEFGHLFGRLADEYVDSNPYESANENCFNGTPPNNDWNGVVTSNNYYQECNFSNWYRSSQNSIMRAIDAPYFNPISQKWISYFIDKYTGPLPNSTPLPTATPSTTPTSTATAKPSASTNPTATAQPTSKATSQSSATPTPTSSSDSADTKTVTVIAPNGGETLTSGTTYRIKWETGAHVPCSIGYGIANNFTTVYSITSVSDGTIGYYDWPVSLYSTLGSSSSQVKLQITCVGIPAGYSANYFTIASNASATPTPTPTPQPTQAANCFNPITLSLGSVPSSASKGQTVTVPLIVTNNNPSSCGTSAQLGISSAHPSGWNMTQDKFAVSVPGGDSVTVTFTFTITDSAVSGNQIYQFWAGGFGPVNGNLQINP